MSTAHAVANPVAALLGVRVGSPLAREAFAALVAIPFVGPLLAIAGWVAITLLRPVPRGTATAEHPLSAHAPSANLARGGVSCTPVHASAAR